MDHQLEWRCPRCQRPTVQEIDAGGPLRCRDCGHRRRLHPDGVDDRRRPSDPVEACLACGSSRLYVQKDFDRRLGVAVVVVGAVLSPWTYGLSLLACMLIDYGLYHVVPEVTVCYGCDAIHRGFDHNSAHRAHDPLLAERFRREAREEVGSSAESDAPTPS